MLLGEQVEEGAIKTVVGAEACVRKKGDRLEVWVGDVCSMEGVVNTGRMLGAEDKIQCSLHSEEKEGGSGRSYCCSGLQLWDMN